MLKYQVGEKVIAPSGEIGVIKSAHEQRGFQAQGYFVKFSDCTLFMPEEVLKSAEQPKQYTLDDYMEELK